MKFQLVTFKKEGFTSSYGIILQDGKTILRTRSDLVWAGKEVRMAETKAFNEFLDLLEIAGLEIQGRESIPQASEA